MPTLVIIARALGGRASTETLERAANLIGEGQDGSRPEGTSKAFEERQKLETKLEDLQRQMKKQRANELGESAELDLAEALREAFPNDRFRKIDKGVAGADLWQDVVHNGEVCGRIVYDSKNRNAWRNDYVNKLKTDQIDAEGDYAVLATRVFPSETTQMHIQDGVLVAHPARIVVLAAEGFAWRPARPRASKSRDRCYMRPGTGAGRSLPSVDMPREKGGR